jgi:DNA-binding NarL/FixJ family response regulator
VPRRRATDVQRKEPAMSEDGTIRILIAEDHAVVREGLRRLLLEDARLRVVGEARSGHEILSLVLQQRPDVLLLDLDLPGQSGLDAVRSLRDHAPQMPRIVILSAFHEEEYIRRAHELGVAGFLTKGCDGAQLRAAIYQVMAGGTALDPRIAGIVKEQAYSTRGRFQRYTDGSHPLSIAELAVLRRMMGDTPYDEIARDLGRKPSTVRAQAAKVCEKLGVNSRQQAVLKALQLGIITREEPQLG